jgi:hypothetical protein
MYGINVKNLYIILNIIAGLLLEIDLILTDKWIKIINEYINSLIEIIFEFIRVNFAYIQLAIAILFALLVSTRHPFLDIGYAFYSAKYASLLVEVFITIIIILTILAVAVLIWRLIYIIPYTKYYLSRGLDTAFTLLSNRQKGMLGSIGILLFIISNIIQLYDS